MHLKLQELQRVVKQTVKEERSNKALCEELFRVLGPVVMVSKNSDKVFEAANEYLDVLESTGRELSGKIKISVLSEAAQSKSPAVRKLAARLLPERYLNSLLSDSKSSVRCAAAKRLSCKQIKEAISRYPSDDQLRTIFAKKKIVEAGLPSPEKIEEPFDMYGDGPLGDAIKTSKEQDLSDAWYERLAHKLVSEYGANLEGNWEELLATRIAASYMSTGIKLDRDKIFKAIIKTIREREDKVVEEGSLKAISQRLIKESFLDEKVFPLIEENDNDPVTDLLESSYSLTQYIQEAERIFDVKKSSIPSGIKKYRLGEGNRGFETNVPMRAHIPRGTSSSAVERALDTYVSCWNKQQAMTGEPYKLSWTHYPADVNLVGFNLELK